METNSVPRKSLRKEKGSLQRQLRGKEGWGTWEVTTIDSGPTFMEPSQIHRVKVALKLLTWLVRGKQPQSNTTLLLLRMPQPQSVQGQGSLRLLATTRCMRNWIWDGGDQAEELPLAHR
ncbi:hypothetical protein GJ744_010625 [Endocarpon pusillum]|uniref:Uncharacterized protein n=1 Tax=Endocarpon pusillum TaxID=364733 RepID=A0A8H7ATF5_9EURO|nr:hypothetical protein GJ744_010625 [Endocarpon pusillum]